MSIKLTPTVSVPALQDKARALRLDILEATTRAGSGHPSSSWSAVEIVATLFFGGVLRYRPEEPDWPARDRFIMSKGHAAPLLYAALAHAGYFDREMSSHLREVNSPVQGHPIQGLMPGVEATTGSLGQGLSVGLGHVLGGRLNQLDYRVYVLLGDGECEAGQVWEAAMAAAHFRADRLTAILRCDQPVARHCTSWRQAVSSTHWPIGTISPVSSAMGMKSAGETSPRSGCCQRSKASTPAIWPVVTSRCG